MRSISRRAALLTPLSWEDERFPVGGMVLAFAVVLDCAVRPLTPAVPLP